MKMVRLLEHLATAQLGQEGTDGRSSTQHLMGGGCMMCNGSKWETTQMSTHGRIDKYIGTYFLNPIL